MKFVAKILSVGVMLAAAAPFASAGTLYGDFGIVLNGVQATTTNSGGSLFPAGNVTAYSFTSADFSTGSGDPLFPANVMGTLTGSTTFVPTGTGFTMTFGNYGTFTQMGTASLYSSGHNADFTISAASYDLTGTFTPGSYFAGYTGGTSDLVLQFNQNRGAYSGSGTFSIAATPTGTPEPSSLALLGTGLAGIGGLVKRRFKRA